MAYQGTYETFKGTPIGRLFSLRYDDRTIARIMDCSPTTVNRWRNDGGPASAKYQQRAQEYLDRKAQEENARTAAIHSPQADLLSESGVYEGAAEQKPEPATDAMFLVTVPAARQAKFLAVAAMFGAEVVSMDD